MARQSLFQRLFGQRGTPFPAPRVDAPFYAVGDIHGCLPQLQQLLDQMDPDIPVICVGDYVDRGDDSAGVLRWLADRPQITCLKGNHEAMMLGFIDDPVGKGPRWLRYGGLQTLASFGTGGVSETAETAQLIAVRDQLVTAMGPALVRWITDLPTFHSTGNVSVVHAGADPQMPIAMQSSKTLMWGHPDFDRTPREDGQWVIYGHTIMPEPTIKDGRIGIDTGAYATGRLTAVRIDPDGSITFLQT